MEGGGQKPSAAAMETYQVALANTLADMMPSMTERYDLTSQKAAITMATALGANVAALCAGAVNASTEDAKKLHERLQALIVEWLNERQAAAT